FVLQPQPVILPLSLSGNGVSLRFLTTPGSTNQIQFAAALGGSWLTLTNVVAPLNGECFYSDTLHAGGGFYRVIRVPYGTGSEASFYRSPVKNKAQYRAPSRYGSLGELLVVEKRHWPTPATSGRSRCGLDPFSAPFDTKELVESGLDEMRKIIRER